MTEAFTNSLCSVGAMLQVEEAVLKQTPFVIHSPKGKATNCIKHIVARLEKNDYNEYTGLSGFIKKLFEKT